MLVSLDHRKQVGNLRSCRRTIRAIRDSASWTNKLVIERADVDLLFRPDVNSIANHARTDFTFELLARDECCRFWSTKAIWCLGKRSPSKRGFFCGSCPSPGQRLLNARPRKSLGFRSPQEVFDSLAHS
jgi:hypothetical protein